MEICHYCEEMVDDITKDHIFPKSKIKKLKESGESLPESVVLKENIVGTCLACNSNKGSKDYDSFKLLGVTAIRHLKKMFLCNQYKIKKRKYKKR